MTAPLEGIRVVEVANWLAAPAAGALMADLGADVIKVEPPGGDVFRSFLLRSMGYQHDFADNYAFQMDNRGKRSVTVALDRPGGPELVRRLSQRSDVFLTNLLQQRRVRYGLTYEEIHAVNPRIIYTSDVEVPQCYPSGMGLPIKISEGLALAARAEAKVFARSIASQVEHWAQIGRAGRWSTCDRPLHSGVAASCLPRRSQHRRRKADAPGDGRRKRLASEV